ncbi:MAG: sugar transferase [Microbacterium sp.]
MAVDHISPPIQAVARWRRAYARRLQITDAIIITVAVFSAHLLRFGFNGATLVGPVTVGDDWGYLLVSLLLVVSWLLALRLFGTWDSRVTGGGSLEYKRVADASIRLFGVLAIVAFGFQVQLARGYVLFAFPVGLLLILFGRWRWRKWLLNRRERGEYSHRAVVLGERAKSLHVAEAIQRERGMGIQLIGAVTEHGSQRELVPGIPVLGSMDDAINVISRVGADTVIYSGSDLITPEDLQQLGWDLEEYRVDMLVAPAMTGIAGPRIHSRPAAGLPLIYVDYPVFEGTRYLAKRSFDILGAALLLIVLSPLLIALALLVRRDGGPAIFRQHRIGLNGRRFEMWKFRSMVVNAEDQLPGLLDQTDGNGVLFKMKTDPRVTPVGRWLRRHSLDELPQLFNVLRGSMSLVGPRPPLASEIELYDHRMHRRFLVRPGITGLWQVNGRSDLSWDDSVRLDLFYVENWTLAGDLIILWRTLRIVAAGDGAY